MPHENIPLSIRKLPVVFVLQKIRLPFLEAGRIIRLKTMYTHNKQRRQKKQGHSLKKGVKGFFSERKFTEHELALLFQTLEDKRMFFERNPFYRSTAIEFSQIISKLYYFLKIKK